MTTITLPPEIEEPLLEQAKQRGTTPERLALDSLRETFAPAAPDASSRPPLPDDLTPRDAWEELVLGIGQDCGVSLSDEAVSRESYYD